MSTVSPGVPLEDEHDEADGLLGGGGTQVLELEPHVLDVGACLFFIETREGRGTGQEGIHHHSQGPDVAAGEPSLLQHHFRGCGEEQGGADNIYVSETEKKKKLQEEGLHCGIIASTSYDSYLFTMIHFLIIRG